MSLLRSIGLLLLGRATVISTEPVAAGDERLGCEVVFNRERQEFRVLSNVSLDAAQDLNADLRLLSQPREGTHAYAVALDYVLREVSL